MVRGSFTWKYEEKFYGHDCPFVEFQKHLWESHACGTSHTGQSLCPVLNKAHTGLEILKKEGNERVGQTGAETHRNFFFNKSRVSDSTI